MSKNRFIHSPLTRREMLCVCKTGFGSLAMMSLFGSCVNKSNGKVLLARLGQSPQYIPKVKNIIFLYMDGGDVYKRQVHVLLPTGYKGFEDEFFRCDRVLKSRY